MIEQADRFALTTGPDGRVLLTLALRRRPGAGADGFARAQRYWACAPGGAQPRWLGLTGEDAREAAAAHATATAYLPGVPCSGCGDRQWKPVNRGAVTSYVLAGITGSCLACQKAAPSVAPAAVHLGSMPAASADFTSTQAASAQFASGQPAPAQFASGHFAPAQWTETRSLPAVTVRVDGTAAALLWSATGGDPQAMSTVVTDLICRNFGIRRAGADLH